MIFNLTTTKEFYRNIPKDLAERKALELLGFWFEKVDAKEVLIRGKVEIEFASIEVLVEFVRSYGGKVVLESDGPEIEIYNTFRE